MKTINATLASVEADATEYLRNPGVTAQAWGFAMDSDVLGERSCYVYVGDGDPDDSYLPLDAEECEDVAKVFLQAAATLRHARA